MLSMSKYKKKYVTDCRERMDSQLKAFANLEKKATTAEAALQVFAPEFFNHLVIVLEAYFVHRTRSLEKKDGNPLNEVRMIANSLLAHGGVFSPDSSIKYDIDKSITGLKFGDPIELTAEQFHSLANAYFEEIITKFT